MTRLSRDRDGDGDGGRDRDGDGDSPGCNKRRTGRLPSHHPVCSVSGGLCSTDTPQFSATCQLPDWRSCFWTQEAQGSICAGGAGGRHHPPVSARLHFLTRRRVSASSPTRLYIHAEQRVDSLQKFPHTRTVIGTEQPPLLSAWSKRMTRNKLQSQI